MDAISARVQNRAPATRRLPRPGFGVRTSTAETGLNTLNPEGPLRGTSKHWRPTASKLRYSVSAACDTRRRPRNCAPSVARTSPSIAAACSAAQGAGGRDLATVHAGAVAKQDEHTPQLVAVSRRIRFQSSAVHEVHGQSNTLWFQLEPLLVSRFSTGVWTLLRRPKAHQGREARSPRDPFAHRIGIWIFVIAAGLRARNPAARAAGRKSPPARDSRPWPSPPRMRQFRG